MGTLSSPLTNIASLTSRSKSQIAIEYCYRYKDEEPEGQVFWVHGSSITRFDQAYSEIARKLQLPGFGDPNVDIRRAVCEWLSDGENGPWLFVLDNVDDQEVLFEGSSLKSLGQQGEQHLAELVKSLPRSSNGCMLVTTRDSRIGKRFGNRGKPIEVLPFDVEDAGRLLRYKLPNNIDWDEAECIELLDHLHHLPLAITQAAAYISEEDVSMTHYLDLLRAGDSDTQELLEQNYYDPGRDSEIQNSITLTWKISYDQISRQKPRAAEILSLMAVLDRLSISETLLRKQNESKVEFDRAIGTLKAFYLITEEKNRGTFQLHRLVQFSLQRWLERQHTLMEWQRKALTAVFASCPLTGDYGNWITWEAINPHVRIVLGYTFSTEPSLLQYAEISDRAASYDDGQGRHEPAYNNCMKAYTIRQQLLGQEHPDTLTSMNNLALVLDSQGKYDEAEEMHRQTLRSREKVLGKEHPDTLTSMNNLALVLDSQGQYDESEKMYRRALELKETVLGKEHLSTLASMSNLASVMGRQGKYEEAQEMHRQVLKSSEKMLGNEHPSTLATMNNLASVMGRQGKYSEAEEMHRKVLGMKEAVLGEEHPSTLMSINNLASVLARQGKYDEAEEMHRRALELGKKVLGTEHPETLTSMNNLASVLDSRGKFNEAEQMHRQALQSGEKVLEENILTL